MALSQIQCLDDNHVNPRSHEARPEFLYSEDQRLALETLLRDGREAFFKHLEARSLRGFLSELEMEALAGAVEPYDPGSDLCREDAEDEQTPLSLEYWPDMSDMSIPQLDMGWPDSEAYRGVTRTTVYTQPPLDGQAHIKEVIRKMIAQAQKVIAVVMDVFTDVDIFKDLLNASYKRKVSVYILLERTTIPNFLSMCQRANMHTGHLKNLRVRSSEGTEFYTHSCTKVRGRMGHRFMFIDGDKAVSGSYSFTWMSSRLDRNLMTVVTGQAADAFDRLFRLLYTTSKLVDLRRVVTEPEPEPQPVPQPTSVALPSAAVARKLYNPKYALVALGNISLSPSSSPGNNSPKESQKDTKTEQTTKKGRRRQSKEVAHEALHPGLVDLEKAYLFDYLPTWPEPDPPKDVIGFINIRDTSKPAPVHLQRSEMFETSQAIRFSSPISVQQETLPEVAKPRTLTDAKHEENLQKPQQKTSLEAITAKPKVLPHSESDEENLKAQNKEPIVHSPANKKTLHSSMTNLYPHTPEQSVKTVTTATANSPKTESSMNTESSLNSKSALQNRTECNQSDKPVSPSDSNVHTKIQKHNSSENVPSSTGNFLSSVTTTPASANYQVSEATVHSSLTSPGPILPLTTISTSVSKPSTYSPITPSSTTSPPVPKPRTVQLVIKDSKGNGTKIPEVSIVKKPESKTKVTTVHNEPLVETALPQKEPETARELANKSSSKSIPQKSTEENTGKDCSQQKQNRTSQEVKSEEAAGLHNDEGEAQLDACNKITAQTKYLISKAPKDEDINILKVIPKEDEAPAKGKVTQTGDFLNNEPTEIPQRSSGTAEVQSQTSNKIGRTYLARVNIPQKISYSNSDENIDSLKSPIDRSPKLKSQHKTDSTPTFTGNAQQGDVLVQANKSVLRTTKFNSPTTLLSPRGAPEKTTCLHLNDSQPTHLIRPEKESQTLVAQKHSPILDGLLPHGPTSECQIHTPNPRSHTPDLRTPTLDIIDGYGSTTSDEYYECSESPFHESIDRLPFYSLSAIEDKHITVGNSCGGFVDQTTMLSNDRAMSSSETLNLSNKGSLSSILEKLNDEEKATDEKNKKGQDQDKKIEQDSHMSVSRKENGRLDINLQPTLLTELQVNKDDGQPQAPKSNKMLSQARLTDPSLTPHNEATEDKPLPMRELKPKRVCSSAERPDRMPAGGKKMADRAEPSPGSVEKRDTVPPATEEPKGHKQQQKDPGVLSQSRPAQPSRPPRPLSATQSTLAHPGGNQIERKISDSDLQVLDSNSSSRRLPPRPPPPATVLRVSQNKHSGQSPDAQAKPKAGHIQNLSPLPKPQTSFLYTHTHMQQPHISSQHQNPGGAKQEGPGQEEEEKSAFGITLSKLYNLKGLKDRMSKLPTQSRRSSSSSSFSAQPRKSTG